MTSTPVTFLSPGEIIEDAAIHAAAGRGIRQAARKMGMAPNDLYQVLQDNQATGVLGDLLDLAPRFKARTKPSERTQNGTPWSQTPYGRELMRQARAAHSRIPQEPSHVTEERRRVLLEAVQDTGGPGIGRGGRLEGPQ